MVNTKRSSSSFNGSLTRRDLLKIGGIAIPAAMVLAPWLSATAQTAAASFDFYISPTGSDSNPGTLAQPWAITSLKTTSANFSKFDGAGKRIGLMPGTYDVSGLMFNDAVTGALQMPGGTSGTPNYLGSSDANGFYSPRTATLDAKGSTGLYGGHHSTAVGQWAGPIISHVGRYPATYTVGNLVIDGLVFTGFSYKCVRIGGASSGDGPVITAPVTIQNCEFYGGGFNTGDFGDNTVALWIDPFQPTSGPGCLVTNNWFHDTVGQGGSSSMDHLNAVIVWGFSTQCWSIEVSNNSCVRAGNIYGKEGGVNGCNVHHNYVDVSMYTSNGSSGLDDFMSGGGTFSGLTHPTTINNNVVVMAGNTPGGNSGIGFPTLSQTAYGSAYGWQTPVSIYNNTIICASGSAGPLAIMADAAQNGSGIGQVKVYNNIYVNNGIGGSWNGYANFLTTPKSPAVWDYNLYPSSGAQWAIVPDANNQNLCASHTIYTTAASFASAVASGGGISGVDSHSVGAAPTFANTGAYAERYKLASGSAGIGQGRSDGTAGGTPCDMGAWGNGAVWIGCNFGYTGPEPPVLSVS